MKHFSKAPFPQENKWAQSFLQFPHQNIVQTYNFLPSTLPKTKDKKKYSSTIDKQQIWWRQQYKENNDRNKCYNNHADN